MSLFAGELSEMPSAQISVPFVELATASPIIGLGPVIDLQKKREMKLKINTGKTSYNMRRM